MQVLPTVYEGNNSKHQLLIDQILITRGHDSNGEVCHSLPDSALLSSGLQDALPSGVAVRLQPSPVLLLRHRQQGAQAARIAALNELFQQLQGKLTDMKCLSI